MKKDPFFKLAPPLRSPARSVPNASRRTQYDKSEEYKEFLHEWYVENMELGLPSRNINTTTPLLTLVELNEYYQKPEFEELCLNWADWQGARVL